MLDRPLQMPNIIRLPGDYLWRLEKSLIVLFHILVHKLGRNFYHTTFQVEKGGVYVCEVLEEVLIIRILLFILAFIALWIEF